MRDTSALPRARSASGRQPWLEALDFLWLELTPQCNLQCSHCYAEAGANVPVAQTMSYEDWVDVLRQAHDLGCRGVQLTGGEPSLCADLPALLRQARELGFDSVEVFTNGTHLSPQLRRALVEQRVDLAFSVYGSRKAVHDGITGKPGSFAKTLNSIRWALNAGLEVRVGVIEMPANADDIAATKELLAGLGVQSICVDGVRRVGRGDGHVRLSGRAQLEELCGDCWRGKLAVHPDGNVSPCIFSRFRTVGHISQSLATILKGERLHRFRKEVREMSKSKRKTPSPKRPSAAPKTPCAPMKTPCAPLKTPCVPLKTPCVPLKTPCVPLKTPCVPIKKAIAEGPCVPTKKERCAPSPVVCVPRKREPCVPKEQPCVPREQQPPCVPREQPCVPREKEGTPTEKRVRAVPLKGPCVPM